MRGQPALLGLFTHLCALTVLVHFVLCTAGLQSGAIAAGKTRSQAKPDKAVQTKPAKNAPRAPAKPAKLTRQAFEMRELIAASALRGRIEDLKDAIQWNELPPDFGDGDEKDPVAKLLAQSGDGTGLDILATLLTVLSMPAALSPTGADAENPNVFVFPYLATRDLSKLTPREKIDLYRLLPAKQAAQMIASKRYTHWVLIIGADGTWHSFRRPPAAPAKPSAK